MPGRRVIQTRKLTMMLCSKCGSLNQKTMACNNLQGLLHLNIHKPSINLPISECLITLASNKIWWVTPWSIQVNSDWTWAWLNNLKELTKHNYWLTFKTWILTVWATLAKSSNNHNHSLTNSSSTCRTYKPNWTTSSTTLKTCRTSN